MANFYRARLVKNGPFVGVKTWFGPPLVDGDEVDRSPRWQALVRTETTARAILMGDAVPVEVENVTLRNLESITEDEYRAINERADYATNYDQSDPLAAPLAPVDTSRMSSIF